MTKDDYLNFIDDTAKVINWIGENIENEDNAITLITWINKMTIHTSYYWYIVFFTHFNYMFI